MNIQDARNAHHNIVSTEKVIGVKVKNLSGETLGDIKELVLDKKSGHTCYAVLGVGGFLGMGEKSIAVPWKAIKYDPNKDCFTLNADKDKLKNAESLEQNYSGWDDERWGSNVHRYYDTRPYWETDKISSFNKSEDINPDKF